MAGLNLTETSSYDANVVGPVAGEKVTAASVRVMGTSLADRTKWLKDQVQDSGGLRAFCFVSAAQSITGGAATTWAIDSASNEWTQVDVSNTVANQIVARLDLPNGCTLTSVVVNINGGGGHSAAPATKPFASLRRMAAAGSFAVGSASDATAYPAYDSAHSFSITGLSEVINNHTSAYLLNMRGEAGANSAAGLMAFNVVAHFDPAP